MENLYILYTGLVVFSLLELYYVFKTIQYFIAFSDQVNRKLTNSDIARYPQEVLVKVYGVTYTLVPVLGFYFAINPISWYEDSYVYVGLTMGLGMILTTTPVLLVGALLRSLIDFSKGFKISGLFSEYIDTYTKPAWFLFYLGLFISLIVGVVWFLVSLHSGTI